MSNLTPPPSDGANGATPPTPPPYAAPPAYGAPASPPYATPPAYQPPAYPAAPQAAPYGYGGYAPVQPTNTLSIIAMIAAILGAIWILPFIGSLAGAIMGHISLGQIKRTGEKGRGMALTGVILGWIGVGFTVLIGAIILFGILAATANGARYS